MKHIAGVGPGCSGDAFGAGRSSLEPSFWWHTENTEHNSGMWAIPDESREGVVGPYHQAWEHSRCMIATLMPDAIGHVPWRRASGER
ncbi:hypothetical protein AB0L68_37690 [Streptomyces sp. NPDC052164]|uniref:hypothetical protein n=1 Tax=unclassified Streptomyces TaxID=2593676 RepID=UPI003426FC2F